MKLTIGLLFGFGFFASLLVWNSYNSSPSVTEMHEQEMKKERLEREWQAQKLQCSLKGQCGPITQ